MWLLQALGAEYDLTLITGCRPDIVALDRLAGTSVGAVPLTVLTPPLAPWLRADGRGAALRGAYVGRFVRGLAPRFDLLVSAYNPLDFGRPGVHFIADFSWDEQVRQGYDGDADRGRFGLVSGGLRRRLYLGLAWALGGGPGRDLFGGDELIVANSRWSADLLARRYGVQAPVIYPPVPELPPGGEVGPREDTFVCLGRVSAEKRLERVVAILDAVRAQGHRVGLRVLGALDGSAASHRLRDLAQGRDWMVLEGYRVGAEKAAVLRRCRWGIHARPGEPFGIAVAEMVIAGCVPFVPDQGGVAEIVAHPDLTFSSHDEAVAKILAVLRDRGREAALREHLEWQAARFGVRIFADAAATLVADRMSTVGGALGGHQGNK